MSFRLNLSRIIGLLAFLSLLIYFFYLRPLFLDFLNGKPSVFFEVIIQSIYPRFVVESQRYPISQLVQLADQMAIRSISLLTLVSVFLGLLLKTSSKRAWVNCWNSTVSRDHYRGLNFVFFIIVAYISWGFLSDLLTLERIRSLYKPVSFLWLFEIPLPNPFFIKLYTYSLIVFCLLAAVGFKRGFFNVYILSIFIVLQAFVFSFEKTDHHLTTVTYALILMPFMHFLDRGESSLPEWPLTLTRWSIVGVYFLSALEKLTISGFSWPVTSFCNYLGDLRPGFFSQTYVCATLGYLLLLLELLFPLALLNGKWKWLMLMGGFTFHVSNYWLTGIGGWLHPWWLMYVFFFNWAQFGRWLKKWEIAMLSQRNKHQ